MTSFSTFGPKPSFFESLPVELIAEILGELNLSSLLAMSCVSHRLREICTDQALNPWRKPILRNLRDNGGDYEECFRHLAMRLYIPRINWLEILSTARPDFLLFESTLPNLPERYWEECFRRRFLPSWAKRKEEGRWQRWQEAFKKILFRVSHRSTSSCTADEAWTKYIVLNRNGSANLLDASSRSYNPMHLFNEMKIQSNLAHLETSIRLVVEFADVRILAFGVRNKPRSTFMINSNARMLLQPPGISGSVGVENILDSSRASIDERMSLRSTSNTYKHSPVKFDYTPIVYPVPDATYANYPYFTPGGGDARRTEALVEDEGNHWLGGLLLTAQLVSTETRSQSGELPERQDLDLVVGPGRSHYASFEWPDLDAIAPWLNEYITSRIDGQGLGI